VFDGVGAQRIIFWILWIYNIDLASSTEKKNIIIEKYNLGLGRPTYQLFPQNFHIILISIPKVREKKSK